MKPGLLLRLACAIIVGGLTAMQGSYVPALAQSAAPSAGETLLQDDFADPEVGALPQSSDQPDLYESGYADGEYYVKTLDPTHSGGPTTWLPGQYDNTTLSVDARLVGEADSRYIALICRGQGPTSGSEYDFLIDPAAGRYLLGRSDMGDQIPMMSWTSTPAINTGTNTNHLELTCAGSTISAAINGTQLRHVMDRTFTDGQIGLQVGTQRSELLAQANFDNLMVVAAAAPPPPPTPTIAWSQQFGTAGDDEVNALTRDVANNIYVAGTTGGVLAGQRSAGGDDAFIRKLDPAGKEVWTRQFGAADDDAATSVAVDTSGNVFVGGITAGVFQDQHPAGRNDAFVRKLDANGNEMWTVQFGTAADDQVLGLGTDAEGDVYASGRTRGALTSDGSSGGTDAFVRKYSPAGKEIWTSQFGAAGDDAAEAVAVGPGGRVFVAGHTAGTLPTQSSAGHEDIFLRAYDSAGHELWTRQFGTTQDDAAFAVTTDAKGGVYVAGETEGSLSQEPAFGYQDGFVRKYDADGNELWTHSFGSTMMTDVYGVAAQPDGQVFVVGTATGALPDQPSVGMNDGYVVALAPDGTFRWSYQFGSGDFTYATSVVADSSGAVWVGGLDSAALPGQTSAGQDDAFVLKLIPPV